MNKPLLLYFRPDNAALSPDLEVLKDEWDILAASNAREALRWSTQRQIGVGIATLEDCSQPLTAFEYILPVTPRMKWVFLLPGEELAADYLAKVARCGFYDIHPLPLDLLRLRLTLRHANGMAAIDETSDYESSIIGGTSPVMQRLLRALEKMAAVDAPVLIQGESGTGKEIAALAIHRRSARGKSPFIAVNCGALPSSLIQSELFGHERGAFTGAHQRQVGKLEAAAGGTLFLDEIGDLPLELQTTLLRFLQNRTIERIGGSGPIAVDVRVIAATHVDLEHAVNSGHFREDLFYRLNVLHLMVPPLRERVADIEILAHYFFHEYRTEGHPRLRGFNQQALSAIKNHRWPGNVRELINRIRHALVMCENNLITAADLELGGEHGAEPNLSLAMARDVAERSAIETALERAGNNVSEAARQLRISRVTLYRLMQKYDLRN